MTEAIFDSREQLCGGALVLRYPEHRIVTEARGAARRPHQRAVNPRLDLLAMSVRPGDAEGGDEMRAGGV